VSQPSIPLATLLAKPWTPSQGVPNNPLLASQRPVESVEHHLRAKANAKFSARIKEGDVAEISLDQLEIDKLDLYSQFYKPRV
jgi:hypothetical protein